jgi:hypothetical protein
MPDEKEQIAKSNADTTGSKAQVAGTDAAKKVKPGTGPGHKDVGTIGIVFLGFYLIAAILLCFYGLIALWPGPSPSGQLPPGKTVVTPTPTASRASSSANPTPTSSAASPVSSTTSTPLEVLSSVSPTPTSSGTSPPSSTATPIPERSSIKIFWWEGEIWDEVRLLLIVILAGALGSLVHSIRSVYWYVGNRRLKWSWVAKYALQPFAGSALAMIFYVVVRGGFFSPQTTFQMTSPFGFAALAAIVGLFSEQAVLKLQEVAEIILTKPGPGADSTPQQKLQEVAETILPKPGPSADSTPQQKDS